MQKKKRSWNPQKLKISRSDSWRLILLSCVHVVPLVAARLLGGTAPTTWATTWAWTSTTLRSCLARNLCSPGWPSPSNQVDPRWLRGTFHFHSVTKVRTVNNSFIVGSKSCVSDRNKLYRSINRSSHKIKKDKTCISPTGV